MFTREQIQEIQRKLEAMGKKDSQFPYVEQVTEDIEFPVLQDVQNKRMTMTKLYGFISSELLPSIETLIKELLGGLSFSEITEDIQQILTELNNLKKLLEQRAEELNNAIESSGQAILDALSECCSSMNEAMQLLQDKVDANGEGIEELKNKVDALGTKLDDVSTKVTDALASLDTKLDSLKTWLEGRFTAVLNSIDSGIETLGNALTAFERNMNLQFQGVNTNIDTLRTTITQFQSAITSRIDALESEIQSQFSQFRSWMTQQLEQLVTDIRSIFNGFKEEFFNTLDAKLDAMMVELRAEMSALATRIETAIAQLQTTLESINKQIQDSLGRIEGGFDDLNKAIEDLENSVGTDLESMRTFMQQINIQMGNVDDSLDTINSSIEKVNNSIATVNNSILELSSRLQDGLGDIQQDISNLYNDFKEALENLGEALGNMLDKYVTLTVQVKQPDAHVYLQNLEQSTVTVLNGTDIVLKVTCEGYESYDEIFPLWRDQTIIIDLNEPYYKESYGTLTVVCTPEDAEIKIAGEVREMITVPLGTEVHVTATLDRYNPYDEYVTVENTEQLLEIVLTEATESKILSLIITKDETSEIDPADAPWEGGNIKLKAIANIEYTNGQQQEKDVTDRVVWTIDGTEGGLYDNNKGAFFLDANTGRIADNYTIGGSVTPDSTATMLKRISIP